MVITWFRNASNVLIQVIYISLLSLLKDRYEMCLLCFIFWELNSILFTIHLESTNCLDVMLVFVLDVLYFSTKHTFFVFVYVILSKGGYPYQDKSRLFFMSFELIGNC